MSLLYISVLTFGTPMTTYLLNSGFTLMVVTTARLFSSMLEVSATGVMPWGVKALQNHPARYAPVEDDEESMISDDPPERQFPVDNAEVERVGLWGLWWMVLSLVGPEPTSRSIYCFR